MAQNTDKCVWSPSQQLDRLRVRWDLKQCVLPVPDRRLSDLYELIILVLENSTAVKVRTLAKVGIWQNNCHVTSTRFCNTGHD